MSLSVRKKTRRGKLQSSVEKTAVKKRARQVNNANERNLIAEEIASQISGKLVDAEKFAAKGMIAAEIAHEINNFLANIGSSLYLFEHMQLAPEARRETMAEISGEIARMSAVIKGLLDVYRPNENFMQPVCINSEVEEVLAIARRKLNGKGISVVTHLESGLPPILCYAGHVKQMLLTLIKYSEFLIERSGANLMMVNTCTFGRRIKVAVEKGCNGKPASPGGRSTDVPGGNLHELELDICVRLARRYSGAVRTKKNGTELLLPF